MNIDMVIGIALGAVLAMITFGFLVRRWGSNDSPELDYKSRAIALMYLTDKKSELEDELAADKYPGARFGAEHDIRCLENAITFLNEKR